MIREPTVTTIIDATSVDTTPVVVGVAQNIAGYAEVTLHITSAATTTNDFTIEVYVDPDLTTAPTAITAMFWVKQIVVDVSVADDVAVKIDAGAKWLLLQASHASAAANATIKMVGVAAMI